MPRERAYPLFTQLLRFCRRLAPASMRTRVRRRLFEWLELSWPLPGGVSIRIADYSDWIVYNEIFVNGEYDRALAIAIDTAAAGPIRIVDLGANTGFFTLRAVDTLRRRDRGEFAITAVEGNARSARECGARLFEDNRLSGHVQLVHGAVGQRSGTAVIRDDRHASTIIGASGEGGAAGAQVPYVDLSPLFAEVTSIDLLKCDIEGSEQLFIEQYPDLLQKVRVAVFEFHRDRCDVERCQALLRDYGFSNEAMLRRGEADFTLVVWR